MLYGKLPKTVTFSFVSLVSSTFKTSLFIIMILSLKFCSKFLDKTVSFSMTIIFFGFFLL